MVGEELFHIYGWKVLMGWRMKQKGEEDANENGIKNQNI